MGIIGVTPGTCQMLICVLHYTILLLSSWSSGKHSYHTSYSIKWALSSILTITPNLG